MKKKLLLTFFIACLTLSTLIGCSSNTAEDNTDKTQDTNKEENDSNASEDTEEADDNEGSEGTQEPEETPIVRALEEVDATEFTAVETAFTNVVLSLREKGLISEDFVCVTMDTKTIKFDITPDNGTVDLTLYKPDATNDFYIFALDQNLWYLEGFGELINGIDPAPYNKEAILAMLSLVSADSQAIFDTIDQTYFSAFALSEEEWTAVGSCQMRDGGTAIENAWSYHIKTDE